MLLRDFLRLYKKNTIVTYKIELRLEIIRAPLSEISNSIDNRGERIYLCLKNNASLEEDWRKNFASFPSPLCPCFRISFRINNFVAINASATPGTELLAGIGGKNWCTRRGRLASGGKEGETRKRREGYEGSRTRPSSLP